MLPGRRHQQREERRQLRGHHGHLQLIRALALITLAACSRGSSDVGGLCLDVAQETRACWRGEGAAVVPRTHGAALRCDAAGHCVPRAGAASPFRCEADLCMQHQPRLPDDGEWECTDLAGVVVCRGGIAPAGASMGAPDVGWVCGQRPDGGGFGAAICVDLAPDLPDVAANARDPDGRTRWECHYTFAALHAERVCVPRAGRTGFVGDTCTSDRPCLHGARCIDARCVPARPEPGCWLDADCAGGRACNFGTCAR